MALQLSINMTSTIKSKTIAMYLQLANMISTIKLKNIAMYLQPAYDINHHVGDKFLY